MVMAGKGWRGEPYRHSLAARGVGTKMMRSNLFSYDIYKKVNILSGGMHGNLAVNMAIENHPDLWDSKTPLAADAQTIIVVSGSAVGDIFPGFTPDNVIGYIRYKLRYRNGNRIGIELSYLEIRKDWQRKGVGYALLGHFFDHAVGYDNNVLIAYGSEEGKAFWDRFYKDSNVRNELWERDVTITIEE